jgi:hypothetical protein
MKLLGYIAIIADIVLLNLHSIYNSPILEWYTFDVAFSAVVTMWIIYAAILNLTDHKPNICQGYSILWLGINHGWDFYQTVINTNIGSPIGEIIIFTVGILSIQFYFNLNPEPHIKRHGK